MQAGNHIDTYLEKIVAIVFALFHRFELLTQLPRLSKACVCVCTRERGWGGTEIEGRIMSQMQVKEKMSRADHVIWTEGVMESTVQQLKMVLRDLG